jgi:serine/threonine protein kinase/Tfp pilus assembly protein PilF
MLDEEARLGSFMGTIPPIEDQDPPTSKPSFESGQIIADRYRIDRLIKCGGMGAVYEAEDTRLGRRTALKTILPEIAEDDLMMQRFRREVLLASHVTHKNVCRVYDFGEHVDSSGDRVAFLTMEFLPGETLSDRLKRRGRGTPAEAMPIIRQIAHGLRAAHEAGVVHRDFKPGNVMLVPNPDGSERAVVTDFGLARSTAERSEHTLTRSGQVLGTPEYMSPEQWSGAEVGPAADLYALGAVMHEMTSPSAGELSDEDRRWKSVVDWCLARNPADRPSSAADVLQALEHGRAPTTERSVGVKFMAAMATVTVLAICMALFVLHSRYQDRSGERSAQSGPMPISRRIAVLPIRGGVKSDLFLQGLTDAVTARLSQYGSPKYKLFIVPASEVRRENINNAAGARSRFGAQYVVEATLQSENERVRLTLALIDVGQMRQTESAVVEGTLANALALQDAAVTRITNMLEVDIRPEFARQLHQFSPVVPGVYELYLQARGYLRRNDTPADVKSAIEILQRALELDPTYASAHASLGEAYWRRWEREGEPMWADKALVHGKRALGLRPDLPEAHTAMGVMYSGTGENTLAFEHFERALQIHPRSVDTHLALGRARARAKDFTGANAAFRKALELEPQDWRGYRELGLMLYNQTPPNLDGAIEQFEHVIKLTPDNPGAYTNLGAFYAQRQNYSKAEQMLTKALQVDPNWLGALANMGKLLFDQGRHAEAAAAWSKAADLDESSYRLWGNLGAAYEKLGEPQKANASYSRAVRLLEARIARNPSDADLYSSRAHYRERLGDRKGAIADLRKAEVEGRSVTALVRDADTLVELGEMERARDVLRQALNAGYSADEAMKNERLRRALIGWNFRGDNNVTKR